MLQLLNSTFLRSIVLGSLILGSTSTIVSSSHAAPGHTAEAPAPIIDPNSHSSDPKQIAEQLRKAAIANEKLSPDTRVIKIERTDKELWMYNPVPYWKITIADWRQTLIYFTTENGRFSALMQRNGKPVHPLGQPAQEIAPPELANEAIRKAKEWGYSSREFPQVISEKVSWSSGCENVQAPYACDPILRNGWKITVPFQSSRWVFRGENVADLQLIARSNSSLERRLPPSIQAEARRLASKHFRLPAEVVMITEIGLQTYGDNCLGLGDLNENCGRLSDRNTVKAYRIKVSGKPNEQQIYRISQDGKHSRTEAIAGLPTRTDELPTVVAAKVFNAARSDFKQSIANLRVLQTEATYECLRGPLGPPNKDCIPTQSIKGWKVTVSNFQRTRTYTVNLDGAILKKS